MAKRKSKKNPVAVRMDDQLCWPAAELQRVGYTPTGEPDIVVSGHVGYGYGAQRNAAIRLDCALESIRAFRTAPDTWSLFFVPGEIVRPFADKALLP